MGAFHIRQLPQPPGPLLWIKWFRIAWNHHFSNVHHHRHIYHRNYGKDLCVTNMKYINNYPHLWWNWPTSARSLHLSMNRETSFEFFWDSTKYTNKDTHPSEPSRGSFINWRNSAWCSWIILKSWGFCFPSSWSMGCNRSSWLNLKTTNVDIEK